MSSSEESDSDWKDHDNEIGYSGADKSSPIFLENSCKPKKEMKPHMKEKYSPVNFSLNSGKGYIPPKKLSLHHNQTSETDHPCVVENIIYIDFKTANEESHANGNTRAELLKMSEEKVLATEQKEASTGDYPDDTSNNELRGDSEGEATTENILGSESDDSDDGYVTVRSRISLDSVAQKKYPLDKFAHKKSGSALEAVYTNVPILQGLIPQFVQSGDMATDKPDSEKEGDYCKLLPLGTREEKETPEMFYSYTVRQVHDCFISCGLEQLANTCKEEKLDGAFFQHLMNENFSELLSKEPFNLTLLDTFKVKTIIRGWRPKVSIKKPQS